MAQLTLLRHTTPDVVAGTCYGRSDLPLAASFADECCRVLDNLPAFDHLLTSPLKRCRQLAERIGQSTGVVPQVTASWTEMDFGNWENRLWSELPRAELEAWAADFMHFRTHGGESVTQLRTRIATALEDLPKGRCLIVTHMGAIKAALDIYSHRDAWEVSLDFGAKIDL